MSDSTPLHHVWQYTDTDRDFWLRHLEDWVPDEIFDGHIHVFDDANRRQPMTAEMRQSYWVNELSYSHSVADLERIIKIVWPGRRVRHLCFGWPDLDYDIEASNDYLAENCQRNEWSSLLLTPPTYTQEQVDQALKQPGMIGIKPYYALISHTPEHRDIHVEASIFDFLPHHILEVADHHHAWVTLHVPKSARLGHPDNLREIAEIRRKYPQIQLVIAHLGRCYTLPHAQEAFTPELAADDGLYFDTSAVLNREVIRLALTRFGPDRIVFGTDNPIFYMRGRRQWQGRTYRNRTSHPFYFNRDRESPEIEGAYTLYMYEMLKALKDACNDVGLNRQEVEGIMRNNSLRLIAQKI